MLNYYLFETLGMLTNATVILNGHFHDLLGLPVPPWNFLEIAVVVFFLGWMPILSTSRQCQNNENKKLSYHRDSAGWRSLRCSGSFKVTDFCTNQLRSKDPIKPTIALALRLGFCFTRKQIKLTISNFP